jgi:hypothetical protein
MLTDEELIDQLRSELAPLCPADDLIECLREQAAADQHHGTGRPRRLRGGHRRAIRSTGGFLALVASGLIVLAVGALLLVGHRHPHRAATSTSQSGERVPTLAELKAGFAVLRRPQTAADRAVRTLCPRPCTERLLPGLTRLARTLPGGSRVFLGVWQLRVAQRRAPAGSYGLDEVVAGAKGAAILDPTSIASTPVLVGGALSGLPTADVAPSVPLWTAVVPDGVSSVRWTFVCPHGRNDCRPADSEPVSVDVKVVDNIAAARVPATGGDARGAGLAEWYGRDGRSIAIFSSPVSPTTPFLQTAPTVTVTGQASQREILAFLAKAQHGTEGAFTATYNVGVQSRHGGVRHISVTAAQDSPNLFFYRQTPPLDVVRLGSPAATHSYEVFNGIRGISGAEPALYSCARPLTTSRWSCNGPYTGIGMGETNELLGPYPPQALVRGLDNAAEAFTGLPAPPATQQEPAFLFTRRRSTQPLRCLGFGSIADPAGSVCLMPSGVVASYDLPQAATSGAYQTATLRAYSPDVPSDAFTLPAKPTNP